MTNEQYAEIINRSTQNLLNSKKEFKKVYNSDTHGTKSEYVKVKQTGEKYETGLMVLGENTNNSDGKTKSGLSTYVLDDNGNKVREENVNPETGEVTYGDYKKMPDSDLMNEVSNTGMALTIAFSIAQEIGILRDEYDKKIQDMRNEYDKKIRDLQNEIQYIKTKTGILI